MKNFVVIFLFVVLFALMWGANSLPSLDAAADSYKSGSPTGGIGGDFIGASATQMATFTSTSSPPPTVTPDTGEVQFAVIGDYGIDSSEEAQVATLVASWNPDFVITTGDNNYPNGAASTIDVNIGQYYSQYIGNYQGDYGTGSETNRFWPSMGNHDWHTITCSSDGCTGAYFDYFTLPNNERYYEMDLGLVHLFVIDSDGDEPDGLTDTSVQAVWIQNALAASTSCYDLVALHHPPYSSGLHGSNGIMQWPYQEWGADAVLAGHDHSYERLVHQNGLLYFVNGAGGAVLYPFPNLGNLPPEVESLVRYNDAHGAMLVHASYTSIVYRFYNVSGDLIDEHTVSANCEPTPIPTNTPTFTETLILSSALPPTLIATGIHTPEPSSLFHTYLPIVH